MRRHALSRRHSRRLFTSKAVRKPAKNFRGAPMRGGIRL